MFPTFIGILDIQSWWEVPSIAHFCSLFKDAFNLLDFDIEDLEEALLTDGGTESHLLQELIVRLLEGCLPHETRNDISTFNYQMFLRRLFRRKCQEYKCENPFNTDVDFELLPLRQKVEILRALCDFRLDSEDVEESLSNLDSDSLRVEPLGHDRKNSAYWYFYGTRLYREDYIAISNTVSQKQKLKSRDKKHKRRRSRLAKEKEEEEEKEDDLLVYEGKNKDKERIWQVVCFTLQDWSRLVEKFQDSKNITERKLYTTLSQVFMPEIPKLFDLKEKQQRRKILQRNSARTVQSKESEENDESAMVKSKIKSKTNKGVKKNSSQISKNSKAEEVTPPPMQKKGRQTNNSLASAVGQILIDTRDEVTDAESKKGSGKHGSSVSSSYGYGYNFGIEEEEQQVGMHKVLKILKDHEDAWPFMDPVDEQYAPRYYSVVRRPMDLTTMEEKLEEGSYKSISQFKRDFRLIIDNCRQYNGSDNEYTEMAMNLKEIFDRAVDRYLESEQSSDDSLSCGSDTGVNSPGYKNKNSALSSVRHSQRHKHSRKVSKKTKPTSKINKKKTRQRNLDESAKEESDTETKVVKVKDKKGRKKSKKCKTEVKIEENDEEQENEGAISDTNVIKSKKKKVNDTDQIISKNKKVLVKEIVEEPMKSCKTVKKEFGQEKQSRSAKELKDNRKRKDDFEEDCDSICIPKSKSRKIEKKESKELDVLIDRVRKSKVKKDEPQDKPIEEDEKISSPSGKGKKKSKISKEKSKSPDKHCEKVKDKKSKKKCDPLLKNGEFPKENDVKTIDQTTNASKIMTNKIESLVTKNDTESLDSLKDRISERRREEKLKIEQEKKKKQSLKSDNVHVTSKKVPSNGSTNHHDIDKLGGKKVKSKKIIKEEKGVDSKSLNQTESEPKKIKTSYSKHTKVSGKGNPAIQALNQATEQTLNDINKWLDDAPKLSEFSSGSDSPIFHASASDSTRSVVNKQSATSGTTSTAASANTTVPTTDASRKRPSSMKLFGLHGTARPKKVQRTIDRLQPGKSKGNLLSKKPVPGDVVTNDTAVSQSVTDNEPSCREPSDEPKLSLGTVLKNVDSIQLICKSLVSSPNPNLSNDDDDDEPESKPATPLTVHVDEQASCVKRGSLVAASKDVKTEGKTDCEEAQKPKSATPNLSAWFKAFGAPKSKKKEEEEESTATTKKEEIPESSGLGIGRQRRISTGGSSVSESVSSFSQESPPSGTGRSPHQNQQSVALMPSPAAIEPQIRGAGFYQDALSTGSSPYNSPYYTTPPRYSAQLPPTPSPQNHPLSPAYPSSGAFDQTAQTPARPTLYSQISPQSHQSFQKPSPQAQSPTFSQQSPQNCFPQNSPQSEPQAQVQLYSAPTIAAAQNQSPVYPQQSPQSLQSSPYPQPSPQPANYSQSSPQAQQTTPAYSQPSPQAPANNYSQPSPTPSASLNFAQSSPQQQHSSYSQSSPQPLSSYSQPSPQSQHSPYSQPSPQQTNYSQVSPRPPSTYSQPSPQPPGYTTQTPSPYSQPELVIAQPSPQSRGYSQTSPQQPPSYSQTSPQTPSPYSAQPSPQQQPATYSQPSPQTPPSYSQPSPQQPRVYSHPSPQQTPQQQQPPTVVNPQPQQQISNYSRPSPQRQSQQQAQTSFVKSSDDYSQNLSTSPFTQPIKSPYLQSSAASTPIAKPAASKEKPLHQQQQQSTEQHLATLNQQMYQSVTSAQYQQPYASNVFSTGDRVGNQLSNESGTRSPSTRLTNHESQQQLTQHRQVQQNQEQQAQLLSFQQNLTSHEPLYSSGFQTTPYPMPNATCRPVYSGYFDTSAKNPTGVLSPGNSLAPVKKRMYNEPSSGVDASTQRVPAQEQFGFDSLMALAHSQSDVSVPNQFDSAFASSIADSVASNPTYARLQLGLVGRSPKETQQLLSIPRPSSKNDPITAYARTTTPGQSELDRNLLQSLQNAAVKNSGILSMSRRVAEQSAQPAAAPKSKKSKKSKQQQQQQQLNISVEQQSGISGFPQYSSSSSDPMGLKPSTVGGSAFNFAASASATNSSAFYDKEASASAAAAAYAFLDDFRNPNLPSYYSMALRQQQQQQQQAAVVAAQQQQHHQQQQQQQQGAQPQVTPVSEATQQACNKLNNQTPARNFAGHPFLHTTQRPTPYAPPVPPYVTPHGANLGVDPAAYQQYLHSLYALQPPPHHRPTWL